MLKRARCGLVENQSPCLQFTISLSSGEKRIIKADRRTPPESTESAR